MYMKNILLAVLLAAVLLAMEMSAEVLNPNDLANGYYNNISKVNVARVYEVYSWMKGHCPSLPPFKFVTPKGIDPLVNAVKPLPTEMHFPAISEADNTLKLDAAMVGTYPHVALVEVKNTYKCGDPNVLVYMPSKSPANNEVFVSPVGEAWPEKGLNAYKPKPNDFSAYGSSYTDCSGVYEKQRRWNVFIPYGVWVKIAPGTGCN
jgi:hypothetical protein